MNLFHRIAKSDFVRSHLSNYRWYRKYYSGRWELWFIDICHAELWLTIGADKPDNYRQPCSFGPRIAREDYA